MNVVIQFILISIFFTITLKAEVNKNQTNSNEKIPKIPCHLLEKHFDNENVFEILNFADLAMNSAKHYVISNFQDFLSRDEYLKLNVDIFNEILSDDKLNISSENQVFEALISWIKQDINQRKPYLFQLFKSVRLTFIEKTYFVDEMWNEKLIESCKQCSRLVDSYKKYMITNDTKHLWKELNLKKRFYQINGNEEERNDNHIYAFTTYKQPIEIYDILNNVSRVQSFDSPKLERFNTAVINNEIFVIGGRDKKGYYLKSVYKFNPLIGNWSQTTSMNFERRVFGIAVYDDKIFVSGGYPLKNEFECFNSNNEKWEILPNMLTKRYGHSSIYYKNYIYVFGGSSSGFLNTVERYNIIKREWSQSTPMLTKRCYFGVAVLNDKIYAVGGYNGSILNTGEVYDQENDSWTEIAPMNESRHFFELIAYNNKLYAIGGEGINTVEIYDLTINKWQFMDTREDILLGDVVATLIKSNL